MAEILKAPSPYGMLQETDKLIEAVKAVNDRLVSEKKGYVVGEVDKGISQVKEVLVEYKADSGLSNKSLKPLQDIRKHIDEEKAFRQSPTGSISSEKLWTIRSGLLKKKRVGMTNNTNPSRIFHLPLFRRRFISNRSRISRIL